MFTHFKILIGNLFAEKKNFIKNEV